ncbi:MAG TPA: ABC transporter permease [Anaerolineae bacterium]|nr:ABC transporter permease [Anaerolineae bacterium]
MNPLSTWTYFRRHIRHAVLLLGLSVVITIAQYSMVALVWGVFVEPGRLACMKYSKFSMVTPWDDQNELEPEVIARIRAHPDLVEVLPTTIIRFQLPGAASGIRFDFDLVGLMDEDVRLIFEWFDTSIRVGRLPRPGSNELLLSADVANMLGVTEGDTHEVLSSEYYTNTDGPLTPTPFIVVGILESEVELGIVSLEYLNDHELYRTFPTRFIVVPHEGRYAVVDDFLRNEIQSPRTSVMTFSLLNERIMSEALPGLLMLLPVILIVAIAFSLLIVVVNQIANSRRLPEFGVLHATGRNKYWLIRRLTRETGILAVAGWIIAIGLSCAGLYLLNITLFAQQGYDLDYPVWMPIVFSLPVPVVIIGSAFLSVRRTFLRLDPVTIIEQGELSQEDTSKQVKPVSKSSLKPLAPATFYKRHRRRASWLIGGMSVMILAVVLFIFVLTVDADAKIPFLGYLRLVSLIRSPGAGSLATEVVAMAEAHPAVGRVIPMAPRVSMLRATIPPFSSVEVSPFGVYARDMDYLVELYDLELMEGHLPRPGTNEMVIPEVLALNRDLEVGDVIGDPDRPAYPGAPSLSVEFVISGIFSRAESPEEENGWAFISLEFLEQVETLPLPDVLPMIIVPKVGEKDALDDWLEGDLAGVEISVLTHRQEVSRIRRKAWQDMMSIAMIEVVIAVAAAVGLVVLNYIYSAQRQSEFGILYALGYGRRQLVSRLGRETSFTTVVAWMLSAVGVLIAMLAVRYGVYEPRGLSFNFFNLTPWLYTLPIPIVVLTVTTGSTAWTLSRLDPISIIERRG